MAVALSVVELEYREWVERQCRPAFFRVEVRRTRLKRQCDCGCVIDGSEPYRYQVWKMPGSAGVEQRLDCEFCARVDLKS